MLAMLEAAACQDNGQVLDAVRGGVLDTAELPVGPLEILGESGSQRIDTLVHDLARVQAEQDVDRL